MKIWKFELSLTDDQSVSMPELATLLDVQVQDDKVCLWALCNTSAPNSDRHISLYGTGNPMPDTIGRYVATFQWGALVFHVFDNGAGK